MEDYEQYEKKVKENEKRNEKFIEIFEHWLKSKKLTTKTINDHLANADLYLNQFLVYYEVNQMEEGWKEISAFSGDWFIRKCLWSTASSVKTTVASIKKFYQCMYENGYIRKEDYEELLAIIKGNMEIWIDAVNDFNNIEEDWYF